jgi:eukaryotic-like serine/threonine-protein kinase
MNSTPERADTEPEDPRLLRAAQEYLAELEAGRRPRRREFAGRFPDIADALMPYLDALDMFQSAAPRLSSAAGRRPAADPPPAEPLGDFRIEREIGRGGMGVVYEAVQMSLGRRVALKVLPFAAALDAKQLQRFQNEAQAAAALHHTNIVPVYAVGCERGVHYYAMQLIEGQNLADLITQMGPPEPAASRGDAGQAPTGPAAAPAAVSSAPVTMTGAAAELSTQRATHSGGFYRTAARLGAQAAEALEHAHQLGVIHRDIKPANLIVDGRGNLWITDFGLAQFHNRAGLTRTGDLLGTLRYMSPEQAAGQGAPLDPRTDIYSLGATLYELLTLEHLFGGGDHARLLRQILYDEPRPLRAVDRAVPPELETIVLKAVAKNPTDRYTTAQEFADDLNRYLDNKPIRARRPTVVQRGRKWAQRHPAVVFATVLLCLLTAAGSLVTVAMLQDEQRRTKAALDDAKKQAEEARIQAALAEQHLKIAREAVDEMIQVGEGDLLDKPGQEGARNRLLESALKYYQQFIDQRRDDPGAQAELAATKEQVKKILDDLTALQGAGPYHLLGIPEVLNDLNASDEQKANIADLNARLDKRLKDSLGGPGQPPNSERPKPILIIAEIAADKETAAKKILTTDQIRRLKQIDLQVKGAFAFHDPDVVAALKLTAEQKAKIWTIEGNSFIGPPPEWGRGGPGGHRGGGGPGKPSGSGPGDMRRNSDRDGRSLTDQILDVLTAEQLARWKEMKGEPFKGKMMPFGFPGGFGGPGGPGGGPGGPGGPGGGPPH